MTTKPRPAERPYRYYDLIMAAFVAVLICTNFISAPKRVKIGGFPVFGAGVLFFPISYLFGDILTEVYGYARSRRVVWAGFGALVFATVMSRIVLEMPPDPTWETGVRVETVVIPPAPIDASYGPGLPDPDRVAAPRIVTRAVLDRDSAIRMDLQEVWQAVFGGAWRVVLASMLGYFVGEFANSFTLAKMKILTRGRWLWTRTIGSTLVGEAVDSLIFYPLAFYGRPGWPVETLLRVLLAQYCLKVGWEVVMTPVTYKVVGFLKRAEREDYYDVGTDFTPFSLDVSRSG